MKYAEFEKRVVDTFNRMHYVESCDDGFIVEGWEWDVCMILAKAMKDMFNIGFKHSEGYTVRKEELCMMFCYDEDEFLIEALDSFNGIMDKYNVVPHDRENVYFKGLQII